MSEFYEAAEAFRTAQLMKLSKDLQEEKEAHKIMTDLAVDRGERLIELARIANELKDERDKLLADSRRLMFMLGTQAVVEYSKKLDRYWIVYPDGSSQDGIHATAAEAIDAAMESENV